MTAQKKAQPKKTGAKKTAPKKTASVKSEIVAEPEPKTEIVAEPEPKTISEVVETPTKKATKKSTIPEYLTVKSFSKRNDRLRVALIRDFNEKFHAQAPLTTRCPVSLGSMQRRLNKLYSSTNGKK
ncbi:hypothetical protein AMJ86_00775 [bacterium SM23_57]|nr:MAG: hypothetical protein AMJ86_00775 [bacterium SM23_57]